MPDLPNRDKFERLLTRELTRALTQAQRDVTRLLYRNGLTMRDLQTIDPTVLSGLRNDIAIIFADDLTEAYIDAANNFAEALQFSLDEAQLQQEASNWGNQFAREWVDRLMTTTRNTIQRQARNAPVPDMRVTRNRLLELITTAMTARSRPQQIAVTSVSNAISAGETATERELQRNGARSERIWFTQLDERVRPICAPRHGNFQGDGWQQLPPAHTNCRCYVGYRVTNGDVQVILFDDDDVRARMMRGTR